MKQQVRCAECLEWYNIEDVRKDENGEAICSNCDNYFYEQQGE